MNLCNNDHDEVCYEGRNCPACDKIKELNEEIEDLKDKVQDLKNELNDTKEG